MFQILEICSELIFVRISKNLLCRHDCPRFYRLMQIMLWKLFDGQRNAPSKLHAWCICFANESSYTRTNFWQIDLILQVVGILIKTITMSLKFRKFPLRRFAGFFINFDKGHSIFWNIFCFCLIPWKISIFGSRIFSSFKLFKIFQ